MQNWIYIYLISILFQDMLVYIAKEGVTTTDLFRRPGNPTDAKIIIKRLSEGKEVYFGNYNFYTLASVVKVRLKIAQMGYCHVDPILRLLPPLYRDSYQEICVHFG